MSVDPKSIHNMFDEVFGWAKMEYNLKLYDLDFPRLKLMTEALETDQDDEDTEIQQEEVSDDSLSSPVNAADPPDSERQKSS